MKSQVKTHKPPKPDWAIRLTMALEAKGITTAKLRAQLASELGVVPKALEHWMNGRYEPRFMVLVKLADLTEVTTDWILCRPDRAPMPALPKSSAWTNLDAALRDALTLAPLSEAEVSSLATSILTAVGAKAGERLLSQGQRNSPRPLVPRARPASPKAPKK